MSSFIQHKGFKMSATTRTYNITVNHRRYIINTTTGAPGSWNDQSIIRFDELAMDMNAGEYDEVLSFDLYERNSDGTIWKQKYIGGWFISDNGYQKWPIFIPPYKRSDTKPALRWSQWLESVRKDVECTFGILKGRWRILKAGVRLHGSNSCDKVFLTCCSLHNLLLETDGLNVGWNTGAVTDWQQDMGHFNPDDISERVRTAAGDHLDRLLELDTSRLGFTFAPTGNVDPNTNTDNGTGTEDSGEKVNESGDGDDGDDEDDEDDEVVDPGTVNQKDANGSYVIRDLTREFFRGTLVDHFSVMYAMDKVHWPRGMKHVREVVGDPL
jgi:hypothetical protein